MAIVHKYHRLKWYGNNNSIHCFVIFYRSIVDEADEICLGGEQLLEQKIAVCIASRIQGAVILYL